MHFFSITLSTVLPVQFPVTVTVSPLCSSETLLTQKNKNECNSSENVNILDENVNIFEQSRVEKSREEKSINSGGGDARARAHARDLFKTHFGREPNNNELNAIDGLYAPLGGITKDNDELLSEAMDAAVKAGKQNVGYLTGCFNNYRNRGITDNESYWEYEFRRDKRRGTI